MMGDVGAPFGATLAVVGLLLGKIMGRIIGGIFVVDRIESINCFKECEAEENLAPIHLWLQYRGWPEPKIVQRAMLTGIVLTLFGVWLTVM